MKFGFEDRTRELLRGVWRTGTLSAAAARMGIDPANAARHLRTAERRAGVLLVARQRGGRGGHNARLTAAGKRLLAAHALLGVAGDYDPDEGVTPVQVGGRVLYAAGIVPPGPVEVEIRPESVALERPGGEKTPSSIRNRFAARVDSILFDAEGVYRIRLSSGALAFDALIVRGALRDLRLRVGSRVHATIKAVSIVAAS